MTIEDWGGCLESGHHLLGTRHSRDECPAEERPVSGFTAKVVMHRHRTHRRHSTWTADVPLEILADRAYFHEDGTATADFDQWMCDNGDEGNVDYSDDGNPDVEDLSYEVASIGDVTWSAGTADRQPGIIYADDPVGQKLITAAAGLWDDEVPHWEDNEYVRGQLELLGDTVRIIGEDEDTDSDAIRGRFLALIRATKLKEKQ